MKQRASHSGMKVKATFMSGFQLLFLISGLVGVNSQSVPYISFMGTNLPNHSYVNWNLVGEARGVGVQCHTDLNTCCSRFEGWYFPSGQKLPTFADIPIFQVHRNRMVELHHQNHSSTLQGIYRCDIKTNAASNGSRETIYVGLYTSGEGDVTVQSEVQVIVDSDHNGKSSLTCVSTGGPATNVTWTRNSEKLSGGMTVLSDALNARYIHTLTLTERRGGLYQCTVSNNKPSQQSARIRVKAAFTPTNLIAVQKGLTSILVSWIPPTPLGDTTGYMIYYSGGSRGRVDINGGSTHECQLGNLQNRANYTIAIVGTSEHLPSNPVIYPVKIPLVPGKPSTVVSSTTATSISLSWTSSRGSVGSYELVWKRDISKKCPLSHKGSITISRSSTSYTITGLEEDSNYTVTVTATNAAGSAVSDSVTGMTGATAPSAPPSSVIASHTTFSSIAVSWEAVECIHQNGDITGYLVRFEVQRCGCTQTLRVSEGTTTDVLISRLNNAKTYVIEVAAVNSAGIGPYSKPVIVKDDNSITGTDGTGFIDNSTSQSGKGRTFAGPGEAAVYIVGGFVGGVLITAVLGAVIFIAVVRSMRTKIHALVSLPQVPEEQKQYVPTSTNAAYGSVEGVRYTDMPSGSAVAVEGPIYETIPQ